MQKRVRYTQATMTTMVNVKIRIGKNGEEKANKLSLHYTKNVRQLIILCALSRSLASFTFQRLDIASVLSLRNQHGQNV